jgi:glyoxylase-like metal-dependent hydrolase (beta-lactamase superfamily II)
MTRGLVVLGISAVGLVPSVLAQRTAPTSTELLHVQQSVYMVGHPTSNIVVQATDEGIVVVDSGTEGAAAQVLALVAPLSRQPIRYVINTNADADHVSGNAAIARAGQTLFFDPTQDGGTNTARILAAQGHTDAPIIAHEKASNRMTSPEPNPYTVRHWPTDTFFTTRKTMYFGDEPIDIIHMPAAHSDGDVIVHFRRSDVIAAGDVYTPDRFPMINRQVGGSVSGMLRALNTLIEMTVPRFNQMGGTRVVPGHGRLSNEADIVEYRDMLTIIRDRVAVMTRAGWSLEQVKASPAIEDYVGVYGADSGPWTTAQFVEALYRDLASEAPVPPSQLGR